MLFKINFLLQILLQFSTVGYQNIDETNVLVNKPSSDMQLTWENGGECKA